jgi:hypothetical protein
VSAPVEPPTTQPHPGISVEPPTIPPLASAPVEPPPTQHRPSAPRATTEEVGAAVARVLEVLDRSGVPLGAGAVKAALRADGASEAEVERIWDRFRGHAADHARVGIEVHGHAYQYRLLPSPTPDQALARLGQTGASSADRAELVAIVAAALAVATRTVPQSGVESSAGETERMRRIGAVRALAELAIEVEELTVHRASPQALIHRVRSRVGRAGLEPVESAGERTSFDRARHESIAGSIMDGTAVVVVRPGYVWRTEDEEILLVPAIVQDRNQDQS